MEQLREIFYSESYETYYKKLDKKLQEKFDYVSHIIRTQPVVNSKFVKKLEGSEFYEARISIGSNEYRTILFAIDAESFNQCSCVLYLNSFQKKDKKQYKSEIKKAEKIIKNYMEE